MRDSLARNRLGGVGNWDERISKLSGTNCQWIQATCLDTESVFVEECLLVGEPQRRLALVKRELRTAVVRFQNKVNVMLAALVIDCVVST